VACICDALSSSDADSGQLLALMIAAPIAVPLILSAVHPMFLTRTVLSAVFGVLILFARGLIALFRHRRSAGLLAVALLLFVNVQSLAVAATHPLKEDWRGLACYAAGHIESGSLIAVAPGWLRYAFDLYWQPYHRQATEIADPAATSEHGAQVLVDGRTSVWLVFGYSGLKPPANAITEYLSSHLRLAGTERFFGGLTLYHYVGQRNVAAAH
jgi:hypothetical protein